MMFPEEDRNSIRDRLLKNSMPEPMSGCWIWLASAKTSKGYGQISLRHERRLCSRFAHRVSFEVFNCAIPPNVLVRHKCDQPLCINPDHLCLGNRADNAGDMIMRNRGAGQYTRGDTCAHAKISDADVMFIRSSSASAKALALQFSVSERHIHHLKKGQRRSLEKIAAIIKRR